jgi:flagellar motor switch protein FliN/FliY
MADDNELINQDEIERLLQSAGVGKPAASTPAATPASEPGAGPLDQNSIEAMLQGAGAKAPRASPAVDDADKVLGQNDIEKLLSEAGRSPPASKPAAAKEKSSVLFPGEGEITQGDVEFLLSQATQALESIDAAVGGPPAGASAFRFPEFGGTPASGEAATLDLISDVELDLKIELGRTHMYLEDVLKLRKGSVVPLDKLAGDPVDIFVNGRLVARGEVLVLNDNFCVRVAELLAGATVE